MDNKNMDCNKCESLIPYYLDDALSQDVTASFENHIRNCSSCGEKLLLEKSFNEQMKLALEVERPPVDFVDSVMARVKEEQATKKAPVVPFFKRPQTLRVAGSIAAALVLVAGISALYNDNNSLTSQPQVEVGALDKDINKGNNLIDENIIVVPVENNSKDNNQIEIAQKEKEPAKEDANNKVPEKVQPEMVKPEKVEPKEPVAPPVIDSSKTDIPAAKYGSTTEGVFKTRLLASIENSEVLRPQISKNGNVVSFCTETPEDILLWQVRLDKVTEPAMISEAAKSGENQDDFLAPAQVKTFETSPDNMLLAVNSSSNSDDKGVWVVEGDKEPFQIYSEGGGSILSWAPNSGKFAFSTAKGDLHIAYPAEERVFKVVSGNVKSVLWNEDGTMLLYTLVNSENNSVDLYTIQIP